jgi:hypothetical protein
VDVARFGDDRSVGYLRHGLRVVKQFDVNGFDTNQVAHMVWDLVGHRPDVTIKIDAGYNPGVIDVVRQMGGKVVEVNFGGSPMNADRYTSAADEMWFDFPMDEAQIPDDQDLRRELCGRRYDFERHTNRKKIESKSEYKKRLGRSPDKADALLLAFYSPHAAPVSDATRKMLAARRRAR